MFEKLVAFIAWVAFVVSVVALAIKPEDPALWVVIAVVVGMAGYDFYTSLRGSKS